MMKEGELIVFTGTSNPGLAKAICRYLDVPLGKAIVSQFADGETRIELQQNVRGSDVYLIQSTSSPANQNIMEVLFMVDACRRASARTITLVCPYFGYARQERKSAPRTPISAKVVSDLYEAVGVSRLLTLELHTAAIQGFFSIPVDHLFAKPVFSEYFHKFENEDMIVVSPDAGGVERARAFAKLLNCGLAIIDKRRDRPNESDVMHIIGDVAGKHCLIIDDIVDTAGSLTKAAASLKANGAVSISAAITHAVLSGPAVSRIEESCIEELIVTDSIPLSPLAAKCSKIVQISVAELLAKAIRRIHNQDSVSSLFI
jgi:ribose-phosphate pyrophosphokinase